MPSEKIRIIFTPEADVVFSDILKSDILKESDSERFNKIKQSEETKENIIRYATVTLAQNKIPEGKLAELLQEHLAIPLQSAQKLVGDIKKDLLPLLAIYPEEKFSDPDFREEVSKKIFGDEDSKIGTARQETKPIDDVLKEITTKQSGSGGENKKPHIPYLKKSATADVDKNAQHPKKDRKEAKPSLAPKQAEPKKPDAPAFINEKKGPDNYREPIE